MSLDNYIDKIKQYKVRISSRYISIDPEKIDRITPQEKYVVSTKYDGHFYGLVHTQEETFLLNPKGSKISDLPFLVEARNILLEKEVKNLVLAGELYIGNTERSRAYLLRKELTSKSDKIVYAAFDIIEYNEELNDRDAFETIEKLKTLIPSTGVFHIPDYKFVDSRSEIKQVFDEKIAANQEGLIVKGESFATYKLKPKYSLDAVVVGFAEGDGDRRGMVRDLLLAFIKEDGSFQIFSHLSHGFSDEQRLEMFPKLEKMVVGSDYIEVANNKVAFQIVKPKWIVEISCLDIIAEDSKGAIKKMNLNYGEKGYSTNYNQQSVSVVIPVFERFRDDKEVNAQDIRFSQVEEVVSLDGKETEKEVELPKSKMLRREVFKKISKSSTMVRKFIVFKTNKEHSQEYPAYVFHYTDFSPNRKDPLKREIKVSNNEDQILEIFEKEIEKNIKKGWQVATA